MQSASAPQAEWFDTEFWPRYPRKEKKIAARDAMRWAMQNHNQDGQLRERILTALVWQREVHPEWQFWTTPDRWLLHQRWTDEPPVNSKQQQAEAAREYMRQEAARRRALPDLAAERERFAREAS